MAINIEELLSELEGAEKTAEETFVSGVSSDTSAEGTEEKVAEADVDETKETEEKVAEKTETEVEETEEKVAEANESEEEKEKVTEKVAETTDRDQELVKQAMDMGRIAAHTFYGELVAMGIMPATNKDMAVPPISSISMPSDSPVTLKADAAYQVEAGHDGYDARSEQYGQKKTASVVTPEFLTNLHNKIYSEE